MADECPARAVLEAFAAGNLADGQRAEVETHLTLCLPCAEGLDRLTRSQLEQLVGDRSTGPRCPGTSVALEGVMRKAAGTDWPTPGPDLNRVVAAFDPPAREGALGTFAGFD